MTGEVEVVAWLHTLHMEMGQTSERLSSTEDSPWGRPGRDYSEEYSATSEALVPASALEALRADNERLEREKSAALGLVEGHSLTIKSLEATICSQRQRLAKLERDDAAFRADNERLEKEWAKANRERSALWDALLPKHPRCRDCADFDGRCQGDGPPCDPQKRALEAASELKARAERAEASLAGRDAEIAKAVAEEREAVLAVISRKDRNGNAIWPNGPGLASAIRTDAECRDRALSQEPRS